jgi:vacuolar-type H+-ATPase subunit E/Vma4
MPPFAMFCFSILTIRNVRQRKAQLAPRNVEDRLQQTRRKTERQMIQMALVQSLVFSLTIVASSVENIYDSLTTYLVNDALRRANYNLRANIIATIALVGPCTSFYLFTLSSQLFRGELMRLFRYRRDRQIGTTQTMQLARIQH